MTQPTAAAVCRMSLRRMDEHNEQMSLVVVAEEANFRGGFGRNKPDETNRNALNAMRVEADAWRACLVAAGWDVTHEDFERTILDAG